MVSVHFLCKSVFVCFVLFCFFAKHIFVGHLFRNTHPSITVYIIVYFLLSFTLPDITAVLCNKPACVLYFQQLLGSRTALIQLYWLIGRKTPSYLLSSTTSLHLMTASSLLFISCAVMYVHCVSSCHLAPAHLYPAPFGDWLQFSVKICTFCIVLCFQWFTWR